VRAPHTLVRKVCHGGGNYLVLTLPYRLTQEPAQAFRPGRLDVLGMQVAVGGQLERLCLRIGGRHPLS
jgi:hypothetical protein